MDRIMGRKTLIAGAAAVSLMVSGCAGNNSDDVAGALLIGAAVIGLGVLAAGVSDSDDDDRYAHSGYGQNQHQRHYRDDSRDYNRYAGNGRCDDPSYNTSNGGRAARGTDERDCRRYGQGRK